MITITEQLMSPKNPIRELLSALFNSGSEVFVQNDESITPHDDYLDTTSPYLDPDTNEDWERPSLSE